MGWQCQLDHMQIIRTSLQHLITQYFTGRYSSWCPTNSIKALKATTNLNSTDFSFCSTSLTFQGLHQFGSVFQRRILVHCWSRRFTGRISVTSLLLWYRHLGTGIRHLKTCRESSKFHFREILANQEWFQTTGSGIAEKPHDALNQLKVGQFLHNCMKNCTGKNLSQVNDLDGHSRSLKTVQFDRPSPTISDLL